MFDNQSPTTQSNRPPSLSSQTANFKLSNQNFKLNQNPASRQTLSRQSLSQASPPANLPTVGVNQNSNFRAPDDIFENIDNETDHNIEKLNIPVSAVKPVSTQGFASNMLNQQMPTVSPVSESTPISTIEAASQNQFIPAWKSKEPEQQSGQVIKEITVPQPPLLKETQQSSFRKVMIYILSVIILSLLIIGGYLAYQIFSGSINFFWLTGKESQTIQEETSSVPQTIFESPSLEENNLSEEEKSSVAVSEPPLIEPPQELIVDEPQPQPQPEPILDTDLDEIPDDEEIRIGTNPRAKDTDLDKLSDYQEVYTYKTDPLKKDTDSDNLSDYDEINVQHTDPLKNDTDGDGYSDGLEVSRGYNPKGEGKLNVNF